MIKVLISHPHAAPFANGTAAEMERNGTLAMYVTGVAVSPGHGAAGALDLAGRWHATVRNRTIKGIPAERLRSLGWVEVCARMAGRVTTALGRGPSTYDAVFVAHDAILAALPWPRPLDAVYAYEDASLRTFERAAKSGLECVWDLPIPHHAMLERMLADEARRWPGATVKTPGVHPTWKKRRKDAELSLATRIVVPSAFTAESLQEAGVTKRIDVIPFGFPVDEFEPRVEPRAGPFTVLAVGSQDLRKGTPYLLEAWRKADLRDARLLLVGRMSLEASFLKTYQGLFEHVAHVPRTKLADVYRSADLLVLATLGDGCPLVVQEAMCCAVPVLTTRCGNGPEFITSGQEGWVVPERDIDALVDRLRQAATDRVALHRMGQAARRRAEGWTWQVAGGRLLNALTTRS